MKKEGMLELSIKSPQNFNIIFILSIGNTICFADIYLKIHGPLRSFAVSFIIFERELKK